MNTNHAALDAARRRLVIRRLNAQWEEVLRLRRTGRHVDAATLEHTLTSRDCFKIAVDKRTRVR